MKNFLIAGTFVAALGLIPSAAYATCPRTGVIINVTPSFAGTLVSFRVPNLTSSINYIGNIPSGSPNAVGLVSTANAARASGGTVTITGSIATCPAGGSIQNIIAISY